ncbi:MAG: hypothetical protein JO011_07225, partial [Ktedonobacteraceae bacterium]|nr:hypothetical protein [Ktedonobacteraceae bacterium]
MIRILTLKLSRAIMMITIAVVLTAAPFLPTNSALAANSQLKQASLFSATGVDLARYVDPFTGTGVQPGATFGGGDTFPGADAPFGMVQWSPDTSVYNSGGYWYSDNKIKGFSLTHLNGAGCSTYSDIP